MQHVWRTRLLAFSKHVHLTFRLATTKYKRDEYDKDVDKITENIKINHTAGPTFIIPTKTQDMKKTILDSTIIKYNKTYDGQEG